MEKSIEDVFFKWNNNREWFKNRKIRILNEDSGIFETSYVSDVINSGKQKTFEIILNTGKSVQATLNHKFYTSKGWLRLKDFFEEKEKILC